MQTRLSRFGFAVLAALGLAVVMLSAPPMLGGPTPAVAQVSEDFIYALEPYGRWIHHRRFGEVWVPFDLPRGWRPYEYGHWVFTDEWGWFWVSDPEEEDWGWITFHYGRWAYEQRIGWFWVPGNEWAPAWVDWRYGDGYVGWAPLPPDRYITVYEADPLYWVFVAVRYLTQPRWRHYAVPPRHRATWLRRSHVVNRTFGVRGARLAVNPGISPAFVATHTHSPVHAYRVRPRVFSVTHGVEGAIRIQRDDLRAAHGAKSRGRSKKSSGPNAVAVQRTTIVIKPSAATTAAPQPLQKGQRGHLGSHPPRAAQGTAAPQLQKQTPPTVKKLAPPPTVEKKEAPPPTIKRVAPPTVKHIAPPPTLKRMTPPPTVKKLTPPPTMKRQAPPPTVKKLTPPPTMKKQMPPPTVKKHAPAPTVKRQAPPPAAKGAAPAKSRAKPEGKKKSDDKKRSDERR